MKKINIFILTLFVLSCTGTQIEQDLINLTINCDNVVKESNTNIIIGSSIDYSKYPDYSAFVEDDIMLVALESGEGKMIGEVTSLRIVGDTIYVLDAISHSIFRYNLKGDLISKLSARGKANGEYHELFSNCFYVRDMQLYVIDKFGGKLLIYDKDNNFVKSISLKTDEGNIRNFDYLVEDNGKYCLIDKWGKMSDFHVSRMDATGKTYACELPVADFKKSTTWKYGSGNDLISFSNDATHFNFYGIDTIYNLREGRISPVFSIDFGDYKVSKELLGGSENLRKVKGDNTIGIERLSFAGKYIILNFSVKGAMNVAIFENNGNVLGVSKMFRYKNGLNYIELNSPFFADDYSIAVIKPLGGIWVDNYKKELVKYKNGNDYLDYFSRAMETYDFGSGNPILFIQKWKK